VPRAGANEAGFRFFFLSYDCIEPPHVHVDGEDGVAKFWLGPPVVHESSTYSAHRLGKVAKIVVQRAEDFRQRWEDHCAQAN